jgi:hypothetical protein
MDRAYLRVLLLERARLEEDDCEIVLEGPDAEYRRKGPYLPVRFPMPADLLTVFDRGR